VRRGNIVGRLTSLRVKNLKRLQDVEIEDHIVEVASRAKPVM
jgi:hypothetical protein